MTPSPSFGKLDQSKRRSWLKPLWLMRANFEISPSQDSCCRIKESVEVLNPKGKGKGKFSKRKNKNENKSPPVFAATSTPLALTSASSSSQVLAAVGTPGYTGCFICGGKDHDFRKCPIRSGASGKGKGGKAFGIFIVEDILENDIWPFP